MSSLGSMFSEAGARLLADLEEENKSLKAENKRLREQNLKLVAEMKKGKQAESIISDIIDIIFEEYADDIAQILSDTDYRYEP